MTGTDAEAAPGHQLLCAAGRGSEVVAGDMGGKCVNGCGGLR